MSNIKIIKKIMTLIILQVTLIYSDEIKPAKYIAHAGGGIDNITYTNCLEALNLNYELGHRLFEIDFSWTSDNELIALHDWEESYKFLFNESTNHPLDYNTILKKRMINDYTILTLPLLSEWLKTHPDANIVTDIKNKNIEALKYISENFKNDISRYIPQIYFFWEYETVKNLGYDNIILTLYLNNKSPESIAEFADNHKLFAITINMAKKNYNKILYLLKKRNLFVYVHTYNDKNFVEQILTTQVNGIYTDFLYE